MNHRDITVCRQKSLIERTLFHRQLWDFFCNQKEPDLKFLPVTLKIDSTLMDAVYMIQDMPGNYIYIQGVNETGREVIGLLCTDRPKQLPDWDSCFFVGVFKDNEITEKIIATAYDLTEFLENGRYRLCLMVHSEEAKREELSFAAILNAFYAKVLEDTDE